MRNIFVFALVLLYFVFVESRTITNNSAGNGWVSFLNSIGQSGQTANWRQNRRRNNDDNDRSSSNGKLFSWQQQNAKNGDDASDTFQNSSRQNRRRNGSVTSSSRRWWRKFQKTQERQRRVEKQNGGFQNELAEVTQIGLQNGIQRNQKSPVMSKQDRFVKKQGHDTKAKGRKRKNKRLKAKYEGIDLKNFKRAVWKVRVPVNQNKIVQVRQVSFFNRKRKQVTVVTSSRINKTGFSPSTSMRDYNMNKMAIKAFTSSGLSCFIREIDGTLDDTISLIQSRNGSRYLVTIGKEKNLKAIIFKGDVKSFGEKIGKFCSTRYGDVKIYTLSDYIQNDPNVKLSFPVYGREVIIGDKSTGKKIKVISLLRTYTIHL